MDGYLTAKEAAEKWGTSLRNVQAMCADGRIEGASKMANVWTIPEGAKYPKDGRIKSGNYVNWRKNKSKEEALDGRI